MTPPKCPAVLAIGLVLACCAGTVSAEDYDLIFFGGEVIDGTGSPARRADVALRDGHIAALGDLSSATADRRIDIGGKTLVPGFIDIHSHADSPDGPGLRARDERRRAAPNLVAQGITTVVVNQDGRSPSSIKRQRSQLKRRGFGPNAVLMIGHNTIRAAVLGVDYKRTATDEEIEHMASLLREGMEQGAYGLSAGLEYTPGIWSDTRELIALVAEVKPYGGVYIVHERASGIDPMWFLPSQDNADQPTMLDNIHEQIRVAETTGVTTVATHIKARGERFWGSSEAMVAALSAARARGVPIYADQYPYTTSGSDGVIVLIPRWILDQFRIDDGRKKQDFARLLQNALLNPEAAAKIKRDVDHMISRRGGAKNIIVFDHPNAAYIGKSLHDLALLNEVSPVDMVYRLQLFGYTDRFGGVRLRGFSMSESDVETFVTQPWLATASDAGIALPDDPPVHPRFYGTFPRKIRRYVYTRGLLSIEQAIRSMTSLPAEILKLSDRGTIRVGAIADLAVLDLARIRDTATFFEPHQYPEGIDYVMANGTLVVEGGRLTYALPGQVITPPRSE